MGRKMCVEREKDFWIFLDLDFLQKDGLEKCVSGRRERVKKYGHTHIFI